MGWLRERIDSRQAMRFAVATVLAIVVVVLAVQAVTKGQSEWVSVYVRAASDLRSGNDLYGAQSAFLYPPFPAILGLPFIPFGEPAIRLAWYLLNLPLIAWLFSSCWTLSGGSPEGHASISPGRRRIALTLGGLCGVTYMLNTLAHQQTDILIAALLVAGCLAVMRGRDQVGGVAIGIAIAFKATPLFFVPYLIWRGCWRAAAIAAAVAILATLLPDVIHRSPHSALWVIDWLKLYAIPSQTAASLGMWGSDVIYNQSLAGLIQRALNLSRGFQPDGSWIVVSAPRLGVGQSRLILAILFGVIFIASWRAAKTARDGRRLGEAERPAFEASLIVILMLLASPMSSPAHFVVLLLPGLALARLAMRTGDRVTWVLLVAAGILALLPNKDLVGHTLYDAALWAGGITWDALVLWLGCVLALIRLRPLPSGPRGDPAAIVAATAA